MPTIKQPDYKPPSLPWLEYACTIHHRFTSPRGTRSSVLGEHGIRALRDICQHDADVRNEVRGNDAACCKGSREQTNRHDLHYTQQYRSCGAILRTFGTSRALYHAPHQLFSRGRALQPPFAAVKAPVNSSAEKTAHGNCTYLYTA